LDDLRRFYDEIDQALEIKRLVLESQQRALKAFAVVKRHTLKAYLAVSTWLFHLEKVCEKVCLKEFCFIK